MTYPSGRQSYGVANREIRAVAALSDTSFVDLEAVFRPLCPEEECPEWLYRDQHPRASGHRRVAETLIEELSGAAQ